MPSLIPEYEYDIFISYRQKDNKGDMWVSEFVEALKTELESTFKEEISVYFDINPHDGLLETHDVDESLKEKLKCLIFIPIISRTYCDPKAFAWEHEFKVFVDQASKDQYGLKVKLPNGNVASRVLPIVIYDLDRQDIKLCESVLGGVLRGVEFIYKTAGVNRPLRSKEEKPHDNFNDTHYRDQVNKVANTIKDVLNSLTASEPSVVETITESIVVDEKINVKKSVRKKPSKISSVSFLYRLKNIDALSRKTWRLIAMVFILVSIGAVWLGLKKTPPLPDRALTRYDIPLTEYRGSGTKTFALSPDGKYLVYVTIEGLNLIQLNSDAPSLSIAGTTNARTPFFSPDSKWIGFVNDRERKIMKVPVAGGNPIPICGLEAQMNQANWYEHEIIYAVGSSIYRVSDNGGTPELLYPLNQSDNDPSIWNPQLLPDKKTLLFNQALGDGGWSIMTWRLGSKESPVVLVERRQDGRYLKTEHIAYTLNNHLYINKFNPRTNQIISEHQIITTNPVAENPLVNYGSSSFDFSENGILVYVEQTKENPFQTHLVWVDESGVVTPSITGEAKVYVFTAISSDAQYIATSVYSFESASQIEIINTKTGNSDLFVEDAWCPVWSADNSSIYYVSFTTRNQVFQQPLDRSTPPVLLFEIDSANDIRIQNLSSDGRYLPFSINFGEGNDIGYYDMANSKFEMLDYYNSPLNDRYPFISPDGKWVAYSSNNSGQVAIYVAPFPGPGQPKRVTSGRTNNDIGCPIWAPDMTALYYLTNSPYNELWRINIQFSENDFSFEPAYSFIDGRSNFAMGLLSGNIEIHPDGDRFIVQQRESAGEEVIEPRIKVIVNWEQELEDN